MHGQLCLILCNSVDYEPQWLQAAEHIRKTCIWQRIHACMSAQSLSHVQLSDSLACSCHALLSVGFSRQGNEVGFHFYSRDLPNPRTKPASPAWGGGFFTTELPGEHQRIHRWWKRFLEINFKQRNTQLKKKKEEEENKWRTLSVMTRVENTAHLKSKGQVSTWQCHKATDQSKSAEGTDQSST